MSSYRIGVALILSILLLFSIASLAEAEHTTIGTDPSPGECPEDISHRIPDDISEWEGYFIVTPTKSEYIVRPGEELNINTVVVNMDPNLPPRYTTEQDIEFWVKGNNPSNQMRLVETVSVGLKTCESTAVNFSYDGHVGSSDSTDEFEFEVRASNGKGPGSQTITDFSKRNVYIVSPRFDYSPEQPTVGTDITFDASDSKVPEKSDYEWEMGDGSDMTSETEKSGERISHSYEEPDEYEVILKISIAGEEAKLTKTVFVESDISIEIESEGDGPPVEDRVIDGVTVNDTIALNASNTRSRSGDIEGYRWEFGDGTTDSGETTTHTYSEPGKYDLTLTVDGESETRSETLRVEVINRQPVSSFTYTPDDRPTKSHTITFDASESEDPDSDIEEYRWEFGDGTTANGEVVEHSYKEAGTYNVSLTINDGEKTDETEMKMTIHQRTALDGFGIGVAVVAVVVAAFVVGRRR